MRKKHSRHMVQSGERNRREMECCLRNFEWVSVVGLWNSWKGVRCKHSGKLKRAQVMNFNAKQKCQVFSELDHLKAGNSQRIHHL